MNTTFTNENNWLVIKLRQPLHVTISNEKKREKSQAIYLYHDTTDENKHSN